LQFFKKLFIHGIEEKNFLTTKYSKHANPESKKRKIDGQVWKTRNIRPL